MPPVGEHPSPRESVHAVLALEAKLKGRWADEALWGPWYQAAGELVGVWEHLGEHGQAAEKREEISLSFGGEAFQLRAYRNLVEATVAQGCH